MNFGRQPFASLLLHLLLTVCLVSSNDDFTAEDSYNDGIHSGEFGSSLVLSPEGLLRMLPPPPAAVGAVRLSQQQHSDPRWNSAIKRERGYNMWRKGKREQQQQHLSLDMASEPDFLPAEEEEEGFPLKRSYSQWRKGGRKRGSYQDWRKGKRGNSNHEYFVVSDNSGVQVERRGNGDISGFKQWRKTG